MIHMEKLTKYYGDFCAVDGIDLDIRRGEITGLLGPNGAGKTTTMRMLTGYLEPSSGSIRVKDYTTGTDMLAIKRLMGYLPESAPLYHNMLVFDYLDYVARIKGLEGASKRERIGAMVGLCGLTGIMHKPISELSKGLKQRVGLAHAMIDDPEILVLDEPTSGLDPNQIVEIRDIIRSIGRDKTIILSTHILSEAEATCDRIVIIDRGRIVADGSTEMLTMGTGQEKTIHLAFKGADPARARDLLSGMAGVTCVEEVPSGTPDELRMTIFTAGESDLREDIYRAVRATDWILLELRQEGKSLEKIFRELTREE
ncbi:MAG TPA: ATP-binding cassette domain-containing protein [Deltaproteobacteria bacterium]|nr:ATP-binding cassette domain-containing protein [Deltaproteobacteria bacterium]OQC29332.1 MAG: putative ABC transporter ATP-binding protein YxlF [Deltaproteobacteria bacterium ADurb.Bin072]NMD40087.1 ATP-binding cassette domain-containing protein [Deltaproteobacteria bacterium]HNQ85034.1 ATP-binding cassette domain-containing protein [Deltaproteobacteria bacterium]HNS89194.1 ATP-binding cassette domain-containing protein [Deltaproteobacteria bacterium]